MAERGAHDSNGSKIVLDRSRVRILLCDKDPVTAQEVMDLLRRCSYQVTAVKTARQVIEVLNDGGREVDLILAEVELPNGKGFKMLKHIMKEEQLKRIPVVMMSAHDEMVTVVKCLRLGAADYLVKPLRINELLNLWTHMWRRRRMLGLSEKNLIGGSLNGNGFPLDFLVSDPSESNTISTDLFSEDSIDKKFSVSSDGTCIPYHRKLQSDVPALELSLKPLSEQSETPLSLCNSKGLPLKRIGLKLGQSSAFFTYKRAIDQSNSLHLDQTSNEFTATIINDVTSVKKHEVPHGFPLSINGYNNPANQHPELSFASSGLSMMPMQHGLERASLEIQHNYHLPGKLVSPGALDSICEVDSQSCTQLERLNMSSSHWASTSVHVESRIASACDQDPLPKMPCSGEGEHCDSIPVVPSLSQSCFMAQGQAPPLLLSSPLFQPAMHLYSALQSAPLHSAPGPPLHSFPSMHGLHAPNNVSYYPVTVPVSAGHFGLTPMWPLVPRVTGNDSKLGLAERRKAALSKFRKKRKDRCFEKKIRYVSRKRLAEQRPRIKGQFVRQNEPELSGSGDEEFEDEDDDGNDVVFCATEADLSPAVGFDLPC